MPDNSNPDDSNAVRTSMLSWAGLKAFVEFFRAPTVFLMTGLMCLAPKTSSVTILIAFCAGLVTLAPRYGGVGAFVRTYPAVKFAAMFVFFALVASSWAVSRPEALTVVSHEALVLIGLVFAAADVSQLEQAMRMRVGRFVAWALVLVSACLLIDLAADHVLTRWLYGIWPELIAGNNPQLFRNDKDKLSVVTTLLNQHTKPLALLVWAGALLAYLSFSGRLRIILPLLMLALTAATMVLSESETAKLALLGGVVAGVMAYWFSRTTLVLALIAWTIVALLIVPAVMLMSAAGLQEAKWLQLSARQRVAMWDRFSHKALERPLLGGGPRSLRFEEQMRFDAARAQRMQELGPIKPGELGLPLDKTGQVARIKNLNGEDLKALKPLAPLPPMPQLAPLEPTQTEALRRRAEMLQARRLLEESWQRQFESHRKQAERVADRQRQIIANRKLRAERLERVIEKRKLQAERKRLRNIPLAQPHGHNIYVEIWYELGLIGALLITATGIAALFSIWQSSPPVRAAGAAGFATMALISLASHGLWAPWLHSAIAWLIVLMVLASGIHPGATEPTARSRQDAS